MSIETSTTDAAAQAVASEAAAALRAASREVPLTPIAVGTRVGVPGEQVAALSAHLASVDTAAAERALWLIHHNMDGADLILAEGRAWALVRLMSASRAAEQRARERARGGAL